jgi:hypothetical protein
MISKIRNFVGLHILKQLYHTLIYPYLTYALPVWGNTYQSNLDTLIRLQKKAVRIMTFSIVLGHVQPLFSNIATYLNLSI